MKKKNVPLNHTKVKSQAYKNCRNLTKNIYEYANNDVHILELGKLVITGQKFIIFLVCESLFQNKFRTKLTHFLM